jgi:hypothetical protein
MPKVGLSPTIAMDETWGLYNGVDGSTGLYLPTPGGRDAFEYARRKSPADSKRMVDYQWWVERYGIDDPNRAPIRTVNARNLAEAGWGVIWAPNIRSNIRQKLKPLLDLRKDQAGRFYKEIEFRPGDTKETLLKRHGAGRGPADPRKVPYYLLIIGSPEQISFRFQYELDVQYAVGRIHFDTEDDYGRYAQSVADVEDGKGRSRPKQMTFFGTRNPDDRATRRTADELLQPLARALSEDPNVPAEWKPDVVLADDAKKERLQKLLGGDETPALLLTATHGMLFTEEHELQLQHQGALLCQNWPGPLRWQKPIPSTMYFSADDLTDEADVQGLIAFHFACFSAGTPALSDFDFPVLSPELQRMAPQNFLAPLAKRLLAHPRGGALAVLGHVDRAWTISFSPATSPKEPAPEDPEGEEKDGDIAVFESIFQALLAGDPIGCATEYINQRHAELSVELNGLWSASHFQQPVSRSAFFDTWKANNDAKNFIVLGDPAVRVVGSVP